MVDAQIRQRDTMSFVDLDCVRTILSLNWRYVLGAGHLRRPPLLSVFDITLKIACTFSCTCTHTSCYAAVRSHALAQIWVKYKGASTKAGTQLADRNWDQLDSWLPRSITTLQKGKLNPALYEYAHSWFWRYTHLSQDMDVAKALHKLGRLAAPA